MSTRLFEEFIHKYGRLPTEFDPDWLEMVRMHKYRIVPVPDVGAATKCANCGSSKQDGRGYVDFGLQVDWYGVVFLCTICLDDIAKKAGLYQQLEEKIALLNKRIAELEILGVSADRLEHTLLHTFEEVKEYFANLHPTPDGSSLDSGAGLESNETESDKSGITETKSRASKPATSARSTHVPSLAELLNGDG